MLRLRRAGASTACIALLLAMAAVLAGAGCRLTAGITRAQPASGPQLPEVAGNAAAPDLLETRPNELGMVPILMYHEIGPEEHDWSKTPAGFRADLERLYASGYRLVSLNDFLDNRIAVPAGFSPVVLTFDDGLAGQFRYRKRGDGSYEIDPRCAVGILLDFASQHPDFGLAATFFIYYGVPFRQAGLFEAKLQHLVDLGFEIGNHSFNHPYFDRLPARDIQRELAQMAAKTARIVPGYRVRTFALPFGQLPPPSRRLLLHQGILTYRHRGVLLVGGSPSPAPNHRDFDWLGIPRIRATDFLLDRWLGRLEERPGMRYISDGDPDVITFPAAISDQLNPESLGSRRVRAY